MDGDRDALWILAAHSFQATWRSGVCSSEKWCGGPASGFLLITTRLVVSPNISPLVSLSDILRLCYISV